MATNKIPKVQLEDPSETLIEAFNQRTSVLEKQVTDLRDEYHARLEGLQASFEKSADNNDKVMHAVIIVMVVGFITLLFALIAVIATAWQAKAEAESNAKQAPNIELMIKNQEKILDEQASSRTQNSQSADSKAAE